MPRQANNTRHAAAGRAALAFGAHALASGDVTGAMRLVMVTQNGSLGPPVERYHGVGWAGWSGGGRMSLDNEYAYREAQQVLENWLGIMTLPGQYWRAVLTIHGHGGRISHEAFRIERCRSVADAVAIN